MFYLEEVIGCAAGDHGFAGAWARVELEAGEQGERLKIMWSVKSRNGSYGMEGRIMG